MEQTPEQCGDTLSLTGKRWDIERREPLRADPSLLAILAEERGINLQSNDQRLSSPMLFPEMGRAIERIHQALERQENIGIFGDYDADGITATALLVRMLRRRNCEPVVKLPHRASEGYGLKRASVEFMHHQGVKLLITVDTGIAAHDEIAIATSLGIDTIVTDHHHPRGGRPPAYAVIHPTVPAPFPNPHVCGAGVALMLVRAMEHDAWDEAGYDLGLATIGTIGDVMPLIGENRTLVIAGLRHLRALPPSPLCALIEHVTTSPAWLKSSDIAFRVVPRLNAAGRMADPSIALSALLQGGEHLDTLHRLNSERQTLFDEVFQEAESAIHEATPHMVMAVSTRFTPGIVGLVAGKLTERTGKPSLVGAIRGDMVTASLRSPQGIHLAECLNDASVRPHLVHFGGHAQAAGCTFPLSSVDAVRSGFSTAVHHRTGQRVLVPTLSADCELLPGAVSLGFVRCLQSLEPFGAGNREPIFLRRNLLLQSARVVGDSGRHLQCTFDGTRCIGFGLGSLHASLRPGERYDLLCRASINAWNGQESVQLMIDDLRPA